MGRCLATSPTILSCRFFRPFASVFQPSLSLFLSHSFFLSLSFILDDEEMIARSSRNIRFFLEGTSMLFFLLIFMFCLLFFHPFFTTFLSLSLFLCPSVERVFFPSYEYIFLSYLLCAFLLLSLSFCPIRGINWEVEKEV